MKLEITLNDGTKIYPSFDPTSKVEIIKYYVEMWQDNKISKFAIL